MTLCRTFDFRTSAHSFVKRRIAHCAPGQMPVMLEEQYSEEELCSARAAHAEEGMMLARGDKGESGLMPIGLSAQVDQPVLGPDLPFAVCVGMDQSSCKG